MHREDVSNFIKKPAHAYLMAQKRMKLRGIKHTPKRLESDILEKSRNLWEDPSLIRPKCAGKCFMCPFDRTFSAISKIGKAKEDADALMKLASKGSDDIFKAYCGTISLYVSGSVPYLATAKLAGEEVSFAQRGSVGNDKLIGVQYYNDPKIRLLLYNTVAKKKGLHIYSFGDEIVCSKKPNMPSDYLYDTFWDTPYEFPDDGLDCSHESEGALVIKIMSNGEKIRICRNCARDVSTLQFIISREVAPNVLDDIEVYVEHKYHNEGEDGLERIPDDTVRKYSMGAMTDVSVLNSVLRDKLGDLKSGDVATFIIGSRNYGSSMDEFISDLKGSDIEIDAVRSYLKANPCSVVVRSDRASEVLSVLWSDYRGVIASFTSEEIADSFGDVSKMNPAQVISDAHLKYISHDVVSRLPEFKRAGTVTKYADTYAKAAKVGGEGMLRDNISKMIPKDSKTRSLSKAFTNALGIEAVTKCTKEESEFADYLTPFVKQLLDSDGERYRDSMNTLLTATGCGEKV